MKNTKEVELSMQVSHESHCDQSNNQTEGTPTQDSGSVSASSNVSRKVSRQDIKLVQHLIERCLQLYMNKDEVVKTLSTRARIDPGFTTLVWQKLEEENAEFFRAYYIRLKLKKHILLFNHFLEHQYHLMNYPVPPKVPLAPIHNGIHCTPAVVNSTPMGYPVLQHPTMHTAGQHHMHAVGFGISNCNVVNGVPAPGNFHPVRVDSANDSAADATPVTAPNSTMPSMSEMPISPASVSSSGHFPFAASDISGLGMDTSGLDSAFTSDVGASGGLQLVPDVGDGNPIDSVTSLDEIPWDFSLSDLTADFSDFGDLGVLGNCPDSPFLPSDSEILLDFSEQDDNVEEFFVDSVPSPPCSRSGEDKS